VVAASFTNEASRAQVRAHGHRAGPVPLHFRWVEWQASQQLAR
jgi:hypothetical protein